MSDLISKSALIAKRTYMWDEALGTCPCVLVEDIEAAPAVDAMPVVRCKECKHRATMCYDRLLTDADFCSFGERKEQEMYLWWMRYRDEAWGSYVIAPSRGKAKAMFSEYWRDEGEFCDVRGKKIKPAAGYDEAVLDLDCPILEELGVHYSTQEELNEIWEGL